MRILVCALLALGAADPALADDSSASLAAGGIVFTKNTPVRMAAEDLTISPKLVRVRFEFVNDTDKDVETLVAFPLPDIDLKENWNLAGTTTGDPVNFIGFKAAVDGKPITFTVEQRAFVGDKDVTQVIASTGLQLNPIGGGHDEVAALSPANRQRLIAAGLLQGDTSPLWLVRTKFFWPQRFPAHKSVVIEHSYRPVTGLSRLLEAVEGSGLSQYGAAYCIGAPTIAKIEALEAAVARDDALAAAKRKTDKFAVGMDSLAYDTAYILTTANNWNGPIGRFHLTLDKLKPENILSLCWDGELKKTGPTTFESTLTNFAPARDIHMLVIE
jgi:hypothetical protein